jgi:hypothetical protein
MATRRTIELTSKQRHELTKNRDHHPEAYVRERCGAILKIAEGQAAYAVARQGLLKPRDPDAVYHWLNHYEAEGVAGLIAHRQGGNYMKTVFRLK